MNRSSRWMPGRCKRAFPSLTGHPSGTGSYFLHLSGEARYHLKFAFAHGDPTLEINFFGLGLNDEGWGLENVSVGVNAIPLPPAVWLPGSAAVALVARRRRMPPPAVIESAPSAPDHQPRT